MVMDVSFRDLLGIHITREGRRSLGLQHARVLPVAFISKVFPKITLELVRNMVFFDLFLS